MCSTIYKHQQTTFCRTTRIGSTNLCVQLRPQSGLLGQHICVIPLQVVTSLWYKFQLYMGVCKGTIPERAALGRPTTRQSKKAHDANVHLRRQLTLISWRWPKA